MNQSLIPRSHSKKLRMKMCTKKTTLALLCVYGLILSSVSVWAEDRDGIVLTQNNQSDYCIVVSAQADAVDLYAAEELQAILGKISDVTLPIVRDNGELPTCAVLLGRNRHVEKMAANLDFPGLGSEGFTLRSQDKCLIIAGNTGRGTLYGVYTLLEDYLDCRWYAAGVYSLPPQDTIILPEIADTQVPVLDYREVYYADAMDPVLAGRLKLNGNASTMKDGQMTFERHAGWATWCHTAFAFVPPETYFDDHPEYYSLLDGQRQAKQLCFSDPGVFEVVCERVRQLMDQPMDFAPGVNKPLPRQGGPIWADAEDRYWDVSQMDLNGGACECPACRALDQEHGSHMGSLLTFINKLARAFPEKTISTLSYQYTRKPPRGIRPESNVSIMLCNIECTRGWPIADSPFDQDQAFVKDIRDWSRISDTLFIWDYVVNFSHLYSPNPNLFIQQDNIKFFIDHHVKGIFCQGSRELGGEFCELRNYLLAKLLWNPNVDVNQVIDEFLVGYYGPGALPIRRYIDLLHSHAQDAGRDFGINESPQAHVDNFLSESLLGQYNRLFDQAERLTRHDPAYTQRVRTTRMPLMYVQLKNCYGSPIERMQVLEDFYGLCQRNRVRRLSEWGNTPTDFYQKTLQSLQREMAVHIEPSGGFYSDFSNLKITMTAESPGAPIHYTLDGSTPNENSPRYCQPLSVTGPMTIKARSQGVDQVGQAVFEQAALPLRPPVMHHRDSPIYIQVPVDGVTRLTLRINDGGDGNAWDHGDWADARLLDASGQVTWLSDLTPVQQKQGWGTLALDKSIAGNPLRLGGQTYAHGLGGHAESIVVFELEKDYKILETWVDVDDGCNDSSSLGFEIRGE